MTAFDALAELIKLVITVVLICFWALGLLAVAAILTVIVYFLLRFFWRRLTRCRMH